MISDQVLVALRPDAKARGSTYHRQIYDQLRGAILAGRLRPGDRLPSTRDLAARIGLARNTVARAYADLLAEGYLTGQIGSGTYVSTELASAAPFADLTAQAAVEPLPVPMPASLAADCSTAGLAPTASGSRPSGSPSFRRAEEASDRPSESGLTGWGERVVREVPDGAPRQALTYDFRPGTADWKAFPHALWLQLIRRAIRREAPELARYGEPAGYLPLREAIARHLALSRGVVASTEQIVIVSGSQQAIDLLARLWVGAGEAVVVEDPGYPEARRAFAAGGAHLIPLPVDGDGLDVDALRQRSRGGDPAARARLVYVTPSHQFPTGVTLSLPRRLALLDWAAERDVLVVEDDYDSEFHYRGRPVESLQGLDRFERVVYVGTFSTVLFPPFRVGYVVLPARLVEPFVKAKWLADRQTPTLEQLALADFLVEGHFNQHLRRMRRLAAERRAALLTALAEQLGDRIEPPVANTGMHLMLRLPPRPGSSSAEREAEIARQAAAREVGVYPVAPYRFRTAGETSPALLLGYAALPAERIREGIRRLAQVLSEA